MIFAGVLVDYRGDFRLLRLYDGLLQQAGVPGGVGAKDQRERLDCHGHGSGVALVGGLAQRRDRRSKTRYRLLLLPLLLPPLLPLPLSSNVFVSIFAIFVKTLNKHYYYHYYYHHHYYLLLGLTTSLIFGTPSRDTNTALSDQS